MDKRGRKALFLSRLTVGQRCDAVVKLVVTGKRLLVR